MPDLKNLGVTHKNLNYRRSLFIDVDDTCLGTINAFVRWLDEMNRVTSVKTPQPTDITRLGEWLGVDQALAEHWLKEFTNHTWQWGALRPIFDAEQILPLIKAQGWNIIGLCHGGGDLPRAQMRRANLEIWFPGIFGDMFVVPAGASFYPYMGEHDDAICITAAIKTAHDAAAAGHSAWLIKQPWNRSGPDLTVRKFSDWHQILETLTQKEPVIIPAG